MIKTPNSTSKDGLRIRPSNEGLPIMTDTSTGQVGAPTPGLRRVVGPMPLMFISLGSIIGSGWLLGALTAASAAGGASVLSWLLAGVVMVLLAFVRADLAAAYPFAGGTARYPRLAFGALAGFAAGWGGWLQAGAPPPDGGGGGGGQPD